MRDLEGGKVLFIGRFQPFHLGHLKVIEKFVNKNSQLVIGLGSSNQKISLHNPFSYMERKIIIKHLLYKKFPLNLLNNIKIVPIPDMQTDKQRKIYIENMYLGYTVISGNQRLKDIFNDKILWISERYKNISATYIRQLFLKGYFDQSLNLLPDGSEKFLTFFKFRFERLKKLYDGL